MTKLEKPKDAQTIVLCPVTRKELKMCSKCERVKPLGMFAPKPGLKSGRASWCSKCANKNGRNGSLAKQLRKEDNAQ